jgi:hypothetical protein
MNNNDNDYSGITAATAAAALLLFPLFHPQEH